MKIYTFDNKIMTLDGKWMEQPSAPPAPSLPPYTIRLKFTEGVTPTFAYGTGVQVSSSPNVWDLTYENTSWYRVLQSQTNLIEVIDANIVGVTILERLFRNCSNLESVSIFDTSTVTSMYSMFQGCSKLTTVPLFDTSSISTMTSMFYNCSKLTTVPLFNTSSVRYMENTFYGCTSLTTVPLFNTSSVSSMYSMFDGCTNVQSGALALYQQASQGTVSNHLYTFRNCGSNTVTGAAELAQIPSDWK